MRLAIRLSFFVLVCLLPPVWAAVVSRGPYLQTATPNSITIRWRTDVATDSNVSYGTDPSNLSSTQTDPTITTEHIIVIANLQSSTKYYYSIGSSSTTLAGDDTYYFVTPPPVGTSVATRIWVIGDAGLTSAS